MGQAFNDRGDVLGEAYGDTKREVFDKLMKEFKDAAEIRIRSFYKPGDTDPHVGAGAAAEMPRYRCHKEVWALKIREVIKHAHPDPNADDAAFEASPEFQGAHLMPMDTTYAPIPVSADWYRKHDPQAGGYYVVYKDGYKSFSPTEAFEEGYTRL